MFLILFLIFVVVPVVELTLMFKLGNWIGWIPTLVLVLGTGLAGAALARVQGWFAVMRVRSQLVQGVLPAGEVFDGLLIVVAAVLLIVPGVVSDVLGLSLLVPPIRTGVRKWLAAWGRDRFRIERIETTAPSDGKPAGDDQIIDARVIETRVVD